MTDEKPLHVRVAEALGWERCELTGDIRYHAGGATVDDRVWSGVDPWVVDRNYRRKVFRFDTDWSATGSLIERYVDGVTFVLGNRGAKALDPDAPEWGDHYRATAFGGRMGVDLGKFFDVAGSTPLQAVCNLILALHAAGKLKETA